MNKKNIIKFLLKYILPPILIILFLDIYNYLMGGGIPPLNFGLFVIFLGFFFITSFFWAMTEAIGITLKNFFDSDWKGRIVFIIIAVALIVLYKASGRI